MNRLHNVLVTIKVFTNNEVQVKRFNVPIRNDYELETYIDDLDLRFECVLETKIKPIIASLN